MTRGSRDPTTAARRRIDCGHYYLYVGTLGKMTVSQTTTGMSGLQRASNHGGRLLLGLALLALIAADWRAGLKRSPYWVVAIVLDLTNPISL